MKNWKTTLTGGLFVLLSFFGQSGVKVGRIGTTDWLALAQATAGIAFAAQTKDKDVTGGTRLQ
jgi:hypothetical protein